ncbi:MAG: hypothetical protein Q9159_002691 [Coniocarpon cinnabarinum]
MDGIIVAKLPKTIRDAALFTHWLGIKYLWVDAVCIMQDSKDDKLKEIMSIRKIFTRSYVTLYASRALNVHAGILQLDSKPQSVFEVAQAPEHGSKQTAVWLQVAPPYSWEYQSGPSKRAWTLEERALSPRLLIFSELDILWVCKELKTHTNRTYAYRPDPGRFHGYAGPFTDEVPSAWCELVAEYTRRSLTHTSDSTKAIAGIAEEFERLWGRNLGPYHAGFWSNHMIALIWSTALRPTPKPLPEYVAPSWSWLSSGGDVNFFPLFPFRGKVYEYQEQVFEVKDVQVSTIKGTGMQKFALSFYTISKEFLDLATSFCSDLFHWRLTEPSPGPFGPILAGHITLRAPCALAIWEPVKLAPGGSWSFVTNDGALLCASSRELLGEMTVDTLAGWTGVEREVTAVLLAKFEEDDIKRQRKVRTRRLRGVVLEGVDKDLYRRLGSFDTVGTSENLRTDVFERAAAIQEITII